MKLIPLLKRLNHIRKLKPTFVIEYAGQLTGRPTVCISLHCTHGMLEVYTFPYLEAGDGKAELFAHYIHDMSGLPVVDRRPDQTRPNVLPGNLTPIRVTNLGWTS